MPNFYEIINSWEFIYNSVELYTYQKLGYNFWCNTLIKNVNFLHSHFFVEKKCSKEKENKEKKKRWKPPFSEMALALEGLFFFFFFLVFFFYTWKFRQDNKILYLAGEAGNYPRTKITKIPTKITKITQQERKKMLSLQQLNITLIMRKKKCDGIKTRGFFFIIIKARLCLSCGYILVLSLFLGSCKN